MRQEWSHGGTDFFLQGWQNVDCLLHFLAPPTEKFLYLRSVYDLKGYSPFACL